MSAPTVLADTLLLALAERRSIPPLTGQSPGLDVAQAYRVSHAVTARRVARGETPVGYKIGFTNRTIWDEYGVYAPIWGPVYDSTVRHVAGAVSDAAIAHLVEPRIEPEIVFRFARAPRANMDKAALLGCIDGVAHGFEIVQSLFPGWRFAAADCIAAFGLHGALFVGPWSAPAADAIETLARFSITLSKDGERMDVGEAANVLGGPLSALRHFVALHAADAEAGPIKAGDIVTTGTVTRAFPIRPGERWSTHVAGLTLPGMDITFMV